MNIVRVSLFCVAALLVNGAYAKDFSGSAGAIAKTAEFTLSNSPVWESRVAAQQDHDEALAPLGVDALEVPQTAFGVLQRQQQFAAA
ncbi:hypothetical protein EQ828_14620, partial [Ectopseudomonas mendocina]